jgi:hypothetical protein
MVVLLGSSKQWLGMKAGEIVFTDGVIRYEMCSGPLLFLVNDLQPVE